MGCTQKHATQTHSILPLARRQTRPNASGAGSSALERDAPLNGAAAAKSNGAGAHMRAPDGREALAFLRAHSPEGDAALLPGLCQFCERWLEQVQPCSRAWNQGLDGADASC